jgi:hypothetical protein
VYAQTPNQAPEFEFMFAIVVDRNPQVPMEEALEFSKQHNLFYIETSALADSNVTEAFVTILKVYIVIRIHTVL